MDESHRLSSQLRANHRAHDEVQELIALRSVAVSQGLDHGLKFLQRCLQRVKPHMLFEDLAIREPFGAARGRMVLAQDTYQRLDFIHQLRQIEAEPIPFHQGEFTIMDAACFEAARHMTDLIDIPRTGREQALHRIFGRGMQIQLPARIHLRPHRVDVAIGNRCIDQHRGCPLP